MHRILDYSGSHLLNRRKTTYTFLNIVKFLGLPPPLQDIQKVICNDTFSSPVPEGHPEQYSSWSVKSLGVQSDAESVNAENDVKIKCSNQDDNFPLHMGLRRFEALR